MEPRRPYNLAQLMRGGSSLRVLDLCGLHKRFPDLAETRFPLFHSPRLNRSFLIKHNLRRHERAQVYTRRSIVTKLVIPVDPRDPAAGAFWNFIEAGNIERWLQEALGRERADFGHKFEEDLETLRKLKETPSFDPFLLTELFAGRTIDKRFFALSESDEKAFREFARQHMSAISRMASGENTGSSSAGRLAKVLFEKAETEAKADLRRALHMDEASFALGIYGWKGVLYYIWSTNRITEEIKTFLKDLARLSDVNRTVRGRPLDAAIEKLRQAIRIRWGELQESRENYNRVVGAFLHEGDAIALRVLLTKAPSLFGCIGDNVAALSHLTSYWQYWQRHSVNNQVSFDMALDLIPDLASNVTRDSDTSAGSWDLPSKPSAA